MRHKDPKGGSRGESDSDLKPAQDEKSGRHMKRIWSRAPSERVESHIHTSGERDSDIVLVSYEEQEF